MDKTLKEVAQFLNATLLASPEQEATVVRAVGAVDSAQPDQITFTGNERAAQGVKGSQAAAVLVTEKIENLAKPQLVVGNMDVALIEVLTLFAPQLNPPSVGIHPSALVADDVQLGQGVSVGPNVVLEAGVQIGDHTVIGPGCTVGQGSRIGSNTRLDSRVTVYHGCSIGDHVIVQANSCIGSIGFGYAQVEGQLRLVPHNGGVLIEDFVEIGANCCIDRAKFTNTIVGSGTKMDNLVQVGHNVVIGKCCLICAQVGIAGSTIIGDGVVLGGQVGLADNITIGDGVMVGAKSGVMSHVSAGKKLLWSPAIEQKDALRMLGELMRLPKTAKQVKQLTKRLERLESTEDDKG